MEFTKMHGLGNDFIVVNCLGSSPTFEDLAPHAVKLCDRHFGIGADGLMMLLPSGKAPLRMRLLNSDGSEAEMCGNGIRCFAKYAYDRGITRDTELSVETGAGVLQVKMEVENGTVTWVRVDMGEPGLKRRDVPMLGPADEEAFNVPVEVNGNRFIGTGVSMGNPHFPIFVAKVEDVPLEIWGPALECHSIFPRKANIEFVQVLDRRHLKVRVWERGAGVTLACGTGSCASLVAAVLNELTDREAVVTLPGGNLRIEWGADNHLYMTGPAEEVYTGIYPL